MVSENRGSENADVEDNLQEKITALTIRAGTRQRVVERGARAVVRIGRGIDISETWTEWFQGKFYIKVRKADKIRQATRTTTRTD